MGYYSGLGIAAVIIITEFWGMLYYKRDKEPPKLYW